jgi:hypothetical protein
MDRRAIFFVGAALLCLLLTPIAQQEYQEISLGVAAIYILLAILSALDHRSRRRSGG